MKFTFEYLSGSRAGQDLEVGGTVLRIGRDPSCEIGFDPYQDDMVSALHAQILVMNDGRVTVADMGSSNGTTLNGQPVGQEPVELLNGSVLRFGDDGPKISVRFDSSGAAPHKATQVTKAPGSGGGSGLLIVLGLVILLMCVGFGAAASFWLGDDEPNTEHVEPADPADSPAEGTSESPEPGEPAEPVEEADGGEGQVYESPWAKLGVGTTFEFATVTEMDALPEPQEGTQKWVLKELTADEAVIEMTIVSAGMELPPSETPIPLRAEGEGEEQEFDEERTEDVTVPAGTFSCTYRKLSGDNDTVTETWMKDDLPVPIKSVTRTPQMTSTMELTSMDVK